MTEIRTEFLKGYGQKGPRALGVSRNAIVGFCEAPGVRQSPEAPQDSGGHNIARSRRAWDATTDEKRRDLRKLDHEKEKKHEIGASFQGRKPTRFRRTLAEADVTWKTQPYARTPTQHLHHRHPTVARRPPCFTGHASKGYCTLYPNEFPVYFL